MIASLRGTILEKGEGWAIVEAGGVGYEVHASAPTLARLAQGEEAFLFLVESFALYGGGATFYGFLTREEKELFLAFREHVPATGAKKALEYLEKASRSLPDFRRAVLEEDARILTGVFGFTKKTADKLLAALKDVMGKFHVSGAERLRPATEPAGPMAQALEALAALGYKPAEARAALEGVAADAPGGADVSEIVRRALRRL